MYEVKFNMWGLYNLPECIKNEFFLKISNLKKIKLYGCLLNELKFCPNVTDVTVNNFSDVFNPQNQIYWRKLKSFQFHYHSGDKNLIEIFVENNKTSLETINVKIDYMTSEDEINNLFNSLTKLTKLKKLTIGWWSTSEINDKTVIQLKELAINCQQLKIIHLYLTEINSIE